MLLAMEEFIHILYRPTCVLEFIKQFAAKFAASLHSFEDMTYLPNMDRQSNHLRVVLVQLGLFYSNKVHFIKGRNSPVTAPYACLETPL